MKNMRLLENLALHFLIIQTLLPGTVKCIRPEDSTGSSVPGEPRRQSKKQDAVQSVALEMILFPVELNTNCQALCNKWFSTFDDFIRKPRRGISMLKYPMTLSEDGTKLRVIRKAWEDDEAEQGFLADQCLYFHRYCIANADVWLAPFAPVELGSIDPDTREALKAAKILARDTMQYSQPMTLQSMSQTFFGQCCMCRKFAIFPTARVAAPKPRNRANDKGNHRRILREYPNLECQPKDICRRLNEQLFGLNQRSNQWFCNSAFVVKGIPSQGMRSIFETPKHCPCELDSAQLGLQSRTECFFPETILKGIVDAGIRTLEQVQRDTQITSLTALRNAESSGKARTKPAFSDLQIAQSQLQVASLDDCFIQNSLPPDVGSFAAAEQDSNLSKQEPRPHFLASSIAVSSISPQAQTNTLGELGRAASAATHRKIGELDFLASQMAGQGHQLQPLQPYQQVAVPRQQMYVNPLLDNRAYVSQAVQQTFETNLDSFVFGLPSSEQVFGGPSSAFSDYAASGSSSRSQANRGKRKANEIELSERLRASKALIDRPAFSELGAALDAFLQSDDDTDTLDIILHQNQGTTFQFSEPQPLHALPQFQLPPEAPGAAVDLDSTEAAEEEEGNIGIADYFFP